MPKVPEEHLAARRAQIVAAARRCFARNGFHATSMQDVIAEAGLSVGAVYRYFKSKDQLRQAVAEETVGGLAAGVAAVAAHQPPLPLAEAMARVLDVMEPLLQGPEPIARIGIHGWAEALRDPELGRFLREFLHTMRGHFATIAAAAQRSGDLPPAADPDAVAPVLMALVPGYLLQRVHTGGPDRDTFLSGLRALMARSGRGEPLPGQHR